MRIARFSIDFFCCGIVLTLAGVLAGAGSFSRTASDQWSNFARDAQHAARSQSTTGAQPLNRVIWSTPVDLDPQFTNGELLIHYGSPLITSANTVILPVKTGGSGGFRIDARSAADGTLIWSLPTDYTLPPHGWTPVFGPVLSTLPQPRVYFPGPGGTVYFRNQPDSACSNSHTCQGQLAFYGLKKYHRNQSAYNAGVQIDTPLTADSRGNIYFGFTVDQSLTPPLLDHSGKQLASGIARISANGDGTWISAADAAGDSTMTQVVQNCAPALSNDSKKLYIAVSDSNAAGYLVALNSGTLARLKPTGSVRLLDPKSGLDATLSNDGSASPTVGPDGDVYYGVLEGPCCGENHARGWLLHFDGALSELKTPGAFGWDTTASIVPISEIPTYSGPSGYLLMTKYNNYAEAGGDGLNKIAVLDPNITETDPVTVVKVMNEVRTALGPTPNDGALGVREWCINSAAVDPLTNSILANSEDGKLYRWIPSTGVLSESVVLTPGIGEAYTPTVIGPDGTAYAINDATLFAVGR
jgi:hypothetical protein